MSWGQCVQMWHTTSNDCRTCRGWSPCSFLCRWIFGVPVLERWRHLPLRLSSIQIAGFLMQLRRPIWEISGSFTWSTTYKLCKSLSTFPTLRAMNQSPVKALAEAKQTRVLRSLIESMSIYPCHWNLFHSISIPLDCELNASRGAVWWYYRFWAAACELGEYPQTSFEGESLRFFPWADLQLGTRCRNM